MNIDFLAFDSLHPLGESATHPLIRLVVRLPLYPQGVGRIRKAAEAATTPLSLLVAPQGDSDPLRAKARVESYASPGLPPRRFAAVTRPNAPSGASNCGF